MYEQLRKQEMDFQQERCKTDDKFRCLELASRFATTNEELLDNAKKINEFLTDKK